MINILLQRLNFQPLAAENTKLYDEDSFYSAFQKDLSKCYAELIIESPFVTSRRVSALLPALQKLKSRRVKVALVTRDPFDNDHELSRNDTLKAISQLQKIGVQVVFSEGLHRKIAILDRKILYEGSLNICSQSKSKEVMRRIESVKACWQMIGFTKLDQFLN